MVDGRELLRNFCPSKRSEKMSSADLKRGCRDGEISTVALAISNGVDPKKPIEDDWLKRTPLHIACEYVCLPYL